MRMKLPYDKGLKVVSLFDGVSCGRIALEKTGYAVSSYIAFEIDKYAKAISRYNYPCIEQHGNVLDADFTKYEGYGLVIGGSPCTFWSIAKANRDINKSGEGWKLFMRFVEAVRQIKPLYFLYENVASMPSNIKDYISEELGCKPILINSALVSAQNRKRLYWSNIGGVDCNSGGITQPPDKGILLKDIIESGMPYQDKSHCLTASYSGSVIWNSLERKQRSMVAEPITLSDKSQTILATLHKENALSMVKRQKTGLFVAEEVGAALRTREDEYGKFKRLEVRGDGKLNALTTVQTDSVICYPVHIGQIDKITHTDRVYHVKDKTVCIITNNAKAAVYKINLPDGYYTFRKLSVIEAERCQTMPDNYTAFGIDDNGNTVNISNTQRYRTIGNGWTVDIIAHIFSHIQI